MTTVKAYHVNEVFYSIQGEGMRAGTPNVFVRFSGCNLTCTRDGEAGFDCDTEFVSGRPRTRDELRSDIREAIRREMSSEEAFGDLKTVTTEHQPPWVILTGGEPSLQVDRELIDELHAWGCKLAIETNGTRELPEGIDWIACSPKSAEHTLKLKHAHEIRYVRNVGQGVPRPFIPHDHLLISPAFRTLGDGSHEFEPGALEWCLRLVKENPWLRLSIQQHKLWRVR